MPRFQGVPIDDDKGSGGAFGGSLVIADDVAQPTGPPAIPMPKTDESVDYDADIENMRWRAGFSFMRGERQRKTYLDKTLGAGNWGFDSSGNTIVAPAGLKRLGIDSTKARPIDKPGASKADLADIAAHVPPVVGGIGGSLAATGVGAVPGLALAGAGAALGQGASEAAKAAAGYAPTPREAAEAIGSEALGSALGEGAFRVLRGAGGALAGPGSSAMTQRRTQVMQDALRRGYVPLPGQVTGMPLMQRFEGVSRRMFGDAPQKMNTRQAFRDLAGLRGSAGGKVPTKEAIGEEISDNLIRARQAFGQEARTRYAEIDQLVGGRPIVPPRQIKATVTDILKDRPRTADGQIVSLDPPTQAFLEKLAALPEGGMTTMQMQELRTTLRNREVMRDLAPSLSTLEYRMLRQAADRSFDEASQIGFPASMRQSKILGPSGQPVNVPVPARPPDAATVEAVRKLRNADQFYKEGINKFDVPALGRISRDQNLPGSIEPDQVFEYIIKEKHSVRARRVMELLPEPTKQHIRRNLAEELTSTAVKDADDPFTKILVGGNFKAALDSYGRDTLITVMGKQWTQEAYKVADVMKLVTSGNKQTGGLVVASAVLNPLANIGKLTAYRVLASAFMHKTFLKWMTTGFAAPTSKAGKAALSSIENSLRVYTQLGPAAFEEALSAATAE